MTFSWDCSRCGETLLLIHRNGQEDTAETQSALSGRSQFAGDDLTIATTPDNPGPEYLLWTLIAVCLSFSVSDPMGVERYPALIDSATVGALAGLLVLTKGIESSHVLHAMALRVVTHLHSERMLAVSLVATAAGLATVLTNDIALFVVVPFTLALSRIARLPLQRLIAFEALAVNAGSVLTPIGNPQNLFLWGVSGQSLVEFTRTMLPLTVILVVVLLLLTLVSFASSRLDLRLPVPEQPLQRQVLVTSMVLFLPFVVAIDLGQPAYGLALVLPIYVLAFWPVFRAVDWTLLLVFALMFIDLRLLGQQPVIQDLSRHIELHIPEHLYFAGIGASQIISNVPAAILLEHYTKDWRLLAYAVNIGGFGFVFGSMANLIALRLAGQRSAWRVFHCFSLPYLLMVATLGYVWLFRR